MKQSRRHDSAQDAAEKRIVELFEEQEGSVFYSRQLEVILENDFFHWITNRALRRLHERKVLKCETRKLQNSGNISLYWRKENRYYRRAAKEVVNLVETYSDPNISAALGIHGELMVLEAFAKCEFVLKGRNCNEYRGKKWERSEHDLDMIVEKDKSAYGIEVKNMLGYMEQDELRLKMKLCEHLGVKPVFVARMLPKTWIHEIIEAGGFALILKFQLYPVAHKELAKKVAGELGLPVDSPKALADGTMQRFVKWHSRFVKKRRNSQ